MHGVKRLKYYYVVGDVIQEATDIKFLTVKQVSMNCGQGYYI